MISGALPAHNPATQHAVGTRDQLSGFGAPGGLQSLRCLDTALVGGVDQGGQHGQPLAGAT